MSETFDDIQISTEEIESLMGNVKIGGKGRKVCPNCNEFNGARTHICSCGYSFLDGSLNNEKIETKTLATIFDGPGKGRKQCHSCKRYVGARSLECPACGVLIKTQPKENPNAPIEVESIKELVQKNPEYKFVIGAGFSNRDLIVYAPAGDCPVKLEDTEEETVFEWCDSILGYGRKERKAYLPSAIKYWLRFIYPIGTKEYDSVSKTIDKWANELESYCQMS